MKPAINYYLSLISPWAYLGHERLVNMAKENAVEVNIYPIDFSVVFPRTGGVPLPQRSPERKAYRMQELQRWRSFLNIDLNFEPAYFPTSDKLAAAMVINLRQRDPTAAVVLAGACLRACWAEQRDISNEDTLREIAAENGHDAAPLLTDVENALAVLEENSQLALREGVFGAPSYVYDGQLYWGQDRLEFLQRQLALSE